MTRGKVTTNIKTKQLDPQRPWLDTRFLTLIEALFQAETAGDTAEFINGLLSDYERRALLQRWHIILCLYKTNLGYEKIAEKLGCSTRTVSTVARWFTANDAIRLALEKISPNKLTEDELDEKGAFEAHKEFLRTLKGGGFWAGLLGEYERTNKHPYIEELVRE